MCRCLQSPKPMLDRASRHANASVPIGSIAFRFPSEPPRTPCRLLKPSLLSLLILKVCGLALMSMRERRVRKRRIPQGADLILSDTERDERDSSC